jgi:hypothetical protein
MSGMMSMKIFPMLDFVAIRISRPQHTYLLREFQGAQAYTAMRRGPQTPAETPPVHLSFTEKILYITFIHRSFHKDTKG